MRILIKNIKELIGILDSNIKVKKGHEMNEIKSIRNAYLISNNGDIESFGVMDELIESNFDEVYDAEGGLVYPTYIDSHTHLVFATSREEEFEDRINGLSYEEIAERGGGILNSAVKLAAMSEDELFEQAKSRLQSVIKLGTGAIEIKSGYGLSYEAELKILRVVKRLKAWSPIPIKGTFLGAHAIPKEYQGRREEYMNLVLEEILPEAVKQNLVDYVDVFCEKGYFTVQELESVIEAGNTYGLRAKVHVNQFNAIGGIPAAAKIGALSVDHLEVLNDDDVEHLLASETMPVMLPSCSFFLGIPYGNGVELIGKGLPLALASDFNPGSTPSGNMNFVYSLACIKMKLTPIQALNALTINAARAVELEASLGSITQGKTANFILTKPVKNLAYIPYSFGENCIANVFINGKPFE